MNWTLHCGDAAKVLAELPDQSVDCIVTSPPYWGLRDYGHAEQIGLEVTHHQYVAAIASLFSEAFLRRVLKDSGTAWVNLGDAYAGSWGAQSREHAGKHAPNVSALSANQVKAAGVRASNTGSLGRTPGLKGKDLVGLPWHVAFAIQARGWYLRSDIIWSKPNPMPESVTDRPTKAHEYVFLLTKSPRYWYDADAIREKYAPSTLKQFETPYDGEGRKDYESAGVQNPSSVKARIVAKARHKAALTPGQSAHGYTNRDDGRTNMAPSGAANARTVWQIPTEASPYDHFAVMPKALARKCILAGCPYGGVVLDPFAGVATTGVVALQEGRSFVGIELSPKYHAMARERLSQVAPLLATEIGA